MLIRTSTLLGKKNKGEKITMLTAYDATFARHIQASGIDCLLIGDSLGMVIQGHNSTLPVTMEHMVYHVSAVARGAPNGPLLVADLPFMACATVERTMDNAQRLMQAGAHMLKIEGDRSFTTLISQLVAQGVPVCGHLGLRPQSVNQLGGYRVQGRAAEDAQNLLEDAKSLEKAGISLLVLECVPAQLARTVTQSIGVPVIGIGAGPDVDGQVLVLHDLLGLSPKPPSFSRNFLVDTADIPSALDAYVTAVTSGAFPGAEHCFE